jgi:hypothetical protein
MSSLTNAIYLKKALPESKVKIHRVVTLYEAYIFPALYKKRESGGRDARRRKIW